MPSISKPRVEHPGLPRNAVGLTPRDYEGPMSTLCAGCGHDSVTGAIVQAFWRLAIPPHLVAKLSGIGCSSKTTTYFVRQAHGFNSVHGRMPSIATGARAANRDLICIGISGDGDSLSIGLGQLCHAIRRNVNMAYILENNGVYGLTKGQFSASADLGSRAKKGEVNRNPPIDPVQLALNLGASFVARSFSGDKEHLIPILEAAISHPGFALVDVISPCVTFNDHEGSTKSYRYTREHLSEVDVIDFVPISDAVTGSISGGGTRSVRMHDGSIVRFRNVAEGYDPSDRDAAYAHVRKSRLAGEVATGVLYLDPDAEGFHEHNQTVGEPLFSYPWEDLCPGSEALDDLMTEFT